MKRYHGTRETIMILMIGAALSVIVLSIMNRFMYSMGEIPQAEKKIDIVTIQWVSDDYEVDRAFGEYNESTGKSVLGLAQPDIENGKCVIYAHVPKNEYDLKLLEALGHETLHCFAGQFHN